jgi:hypothetical protein
MQGDPGVGNVGGHTSVAGGLQLVTEVTTCQALPEHVAVVIGGGQAIMVASP